MIVRALVAVLALLVAGPLVAMLPFAALAGVLLGAALRLLEWRSLVPRSGAGRARRSADVVVVVAVVSTALFRGLIPAIAVGVVISIAIFTFAMAQSVVRRTMRNPIGRSRTRRPAHDERFLREAGERVMVLGLQGAIFFGSAEGILQRIQTLRAGGAEFVVLDLSRVTWMDMSGAKGLLEACRAWPGRLLLAPVHAGRGVGAEFEALGLLTAIPPGAGFESIAAAVEAAEEMLLGMLRPPHRQGSARRKLSRRSRCRSGTWPCCCRICPKSLSRLAPQFCARANRLMRSTCCSKAKSSSVCLPPRTARPPALPFSRPESSSGNLHSLARGSARPTPRRGRMCAAYA